MNRLLRLALRLLRRAMATVAVLASASVLLFLVFAAAPGDPVHAVMDEQTPAAGRSSPSWGVAAHESATVARLTLFYTALRRGEFAFSFRFPDVPVSDIIADALPATLLLATAALTIAGIAGVGLGLVAAMTPYARWRNGLLALFTGCLSLPAAALAALLIWWLAVSWRLLPAAGWGDGRSAVAPVLVLAIPAIGHIGRMTSALAAGVVPSPHVRTARAKGLSRSGVAISHVLRNIAAPLASFLGAIFGGLTGGTLLVETVFAIPGLGREAVAATLSRDYPVALGCMLTLIAVNAVVAIVAEGVAQIADPLRGRAGAAGWKGAP